MHFLSGLLVGLLLAALLGAAVGWWVWRRFARFAARARQAQRLAELGALTGGLAHEIKNPLSTVQLNLQLLREDVSPDNPAFGRISGRLDTVARETGRLRDILEDFLRYAGKIELQRKSVDVNELLEELVDFFMPQAQANNVRLRLQKSDNPLVVQLDARLIKQAVLNLMINAVQAMNDKGSGEGELILAAVRSGGQALIHVIDTGPGIAPEVLEKVFDAYYSTKKSGTGLGLAMSRRIALEHGGSLAVQSTPGKGSDFVLRLPM